MSGAEPIPEIRHASRTQVRGGDCRVRYAAAIRGRLSTRFAAAAALAAISVATPVQAQTLTAALSEAYNTNPQLLAQRALLRATDEQVPQALSFWRPTVNFTGQVGYAGSFQPTGRCPLPTAYAFTSKPDQIWYNPRRRSRSTAAAGRWRKPGRRSILSNRRGRRRWRSRPRSSKPSRWHISTWCVTRRCSK